MREQIVVWFLIQDLLISPHIRHYPDLFFLRYCVVMNFESKMYSSREVLLEI